MNLKKAVSPLIATILLIVVAVVLVTVVLTWGRGFTQDSLDEVSGITDDCIETFGTLAITSCSLDTNSVILKNNGNYTFDENWTAEILSDGVITDGTILVGEATDLAPGKSITIILSEDINAGNQVTIINSACPVDARASKTC